MDYYYERMKEKRMGSYARPLQIDKIRLKTEPNKVDYILVNELVHNESPDSCVVMKVMYGLNTSGFHYSSILVTKSYNDVKVHFSEV